MDVIGMRTVFCESAKPTEIKTTTNVIERMRRANGMQEFLHADYFI